MTTMLVNANGRSVNNQFVTETKKGKFFVSYTTVVAKIDKQGQLTLASSWNYSKTTARNLYIFLRSNGFESYDNKKAITKAIKDGNIKIVDSLED